MLGQVMAGDRYFVYEVSGLRQNEETSKSGYPIRSSSSVFITVPYNRMNEEMQRITRMGGKIVGIHPQGKPPAKHADKKGEE